MSATTRLKLFIEGETATEADVLAGTEGKLVTADVLAPLLGEAVPNPVVEAAVQQYFEDNPSSGNVVGPASSTNGRPALFDGTTGRLLKVGDALGSSATRNVGTSSGTVAAGDDSRITGALQASDNLQSIASPAEARENIGAVSDADVSTAITAGRYVTARSATTKTPALLGTDLGLAVEVTPNVPVVLTLPNDLDQGFQCSVVQTGIGQVLFEAEAGAAVHGRGLYSESQWSVVNVRVRANSDGSSAQYVISGDLADGLSSPDAGHFVISGQSQNSGRLTNNQTYTAAGAGAQMFGNDYVLKTLADPVDGNTGQVDTVSSDAATGSTWPIIASRLLAADGEKPLIFIPCAKGGTKISQWQPGTNHQDRSTLYGSMVYRALQVGAPSINLCQIGTSDAIDGTTKATFKAQFSAFAAAVYEDLGIVTMLAKFNKPSDATALAGSPTIWQAIEELWDEDPNVIEGPDLSGVVSDDSYHFTTNLKGSWEADQWLPKIQAFLGQAQTTPAATNLLPKPNAFDGWTASAATVTANASGTTDRVASSGSGAKSITSLAMSITSGDSLAFGFEAKAETGRYIQVHGTDAVFGASNYAIFDLVAGTVTTAVGFEAMIEPLSGGYYRCQCRVTAAATSTSAQLVIKLPAGGTSARGDTTANSPETSVLLRNGQLNQRNSLAPFQEYPYEADASDHWVFGGSSASLVGKVAAGSLTLAGTAPTYNTKSATLASVGRDGLLTPYDDSTDLSWWMICKRPGADLTAPFGGALGAGTNPSGGNFNTGGTLIYARGDSTPDRIEATTRTSGTFAGSNINWPSGLDIDEWFFLGVREVTTAGTTTREVYIHGSGWTSVSGTKTLSSPLRKHAFGNAYYVTASFYNGVEMAQAGVINRAATRAEIEAIAARQIAIEVARGHAVFGA